jgi:saccharopepsin
MSDCSNLAVQPDLTITIDTTDYVLTPQDYVMQMTSKGETTCMLGLMTMVVPENFKYLIFGDVFMRKFPTMFSLEDNTVSF